MAEAQTNRRLAAVLAADVVGYSRMMAADEAGTLTSLKRHRETVFDPAVATHKGRVVKLIGDGTLVEFGSVVDAVNCALAIQRAVKAAAGPNGDGITLRIGINLGDVIIDGDDIYGDGVNVAARLEPLASPGGVCVASIVNESIGSRIDVRFTDAGEVSVKNIDRPIRVWKWHPDNDSVVGRPAPAAASAKAPAEQASIAVLPFDNMSGDPEQAYFSDGITEDIITDLSKVAGLMVIARNSSFAYKGKTFDIRTVGRELGVKSVLEGSIRRAGNRVRITAQLINAETGGHVWADRYDRDLTDIFEVQDEVTRHIVDALKVMLTAKEKARLNDDGGTASVEAHDCFLKARELMAGPAKTRAVYNKAREQLERAIQLDPGYGAAYSGLSVFYGFDYSNRWSDDTAAALRRAHEFALQGAKLAPDDPFTQYVLSMTAGYSRDFPLSKASVDKALELNPNYPDALVSRGAYAIFSGNAAEAIPPIELAIRVDPAASSQYLHFLGLAHLMLGNYETAIAQFRERIRLSPETDFSRAFLASALGHLDRLDEARQVWRELMAINPAYSFTAHMNRLPFFESAQPGKIAAGLAKAGLP